MLAVLVLMLGIWFVGGRLGWSAALRWGLIGLVWLAVLLMLAALDPDQNLARAIGDGPVEWALLGVAAVLVWGYSVVLGALKARAPPAAETAPAATPGGPLGPAELDRYSRHILLHDLGGPGQRRLKQARVLVIGAGGLGAPALQYLAAAGVGTLGVIDDDVVEASNLARQVIHDDAGIGLPKVQSAVARLAAQNPHIALRPYERRLTEENAAALFADYDLILDGSDNFDTRYLANRVAAAQGIPLIGAALTQWEGQISTWDPAKGGPCYECVFPERPAPGTVPICSEAGVAGPLPGVLGAMMALEAVKEITGAGQGLRGRMLIYDGLYADCRTISLRPRADCPVCGKAAAATGA